MQVGTFAQESFENIRRVAGDVVDGLPDDALVWRIDDEANTIAWLIWHLARVQDDHVADLAGIDQVWTRDAWAERFGLDPDDTGIGYGDSSDDVAALRPSSGAVLLEYLDAVTEQTLAHLDRVDDESEWERIVDRSWDPPVTAAVRLSSVIADDLQHAGQAAYVRGIYERTHH